MGRQDHRTHPPWPPCYAFEPPPLTREGTWGDARLSGLTRLEAEEEERARQKRRRGRCCEDALRLPETDRPAAQDGQDVRSHDQDLPARCPDRPRGAKATHQAKRQGDGSV